jgi:hypothetical protein
MMNWTNSFLVFDIFALIWDIYNRQVRNGGPFGSRLTGSADVLVSNERNE